MITGCDCETLVFQESLEADVTGLKELRVRRRSVELPAGVACREESLVCDGGFGRSIAMIVEVFLVVSFFEV